MEHFISIADIEIWHSIIKSARKKIKSLLNKFKRLKNLAFACIILKK